MDEDSGINEDDGTQIRIEDIKRYEPWQREEEVLLNMVETDLVLACQTSKEGELACLKKKRLTHFLS